MAAGTAWGAQPWRHPPHPQAEIAVRTPSILLLRWHQGPVPTGRPGRDTGALVGKGVGSWPLPWCLTPDALLCACTDCWGAVDRRTWWTWLFPPVA